MKQLVNRISFKVVAHLRAYFTLNRLIFCLLIALSSMLLKLIHRRHDDSLTKWTKMFGDRQRSMNVGNMRIIRLDSIEYFVALLAFHFSHAAFVGDVRFSAGEFLRRIHNYSMFCKELKFNSPFYKRNIRKFESRSDFARDF